MEGSSSTNPHGTSEIQGSPDLSSTSPRRGRARGQTLPSSSRETGPSRDDFASPRRSNTTVQSPQRRDDGLSPLSPRVRRDTNASQVPTINVEITPSGLRRRNTSNARQSILARQTTRASAAGRSANFTMAGPEDTPALRAQHQPYVSPGYSDLNPAYEQPANTKPVWSLAKPLPRVVRPGMVPTKSEIQEHLVHAVPGEQAQKAGVDVDPEDLEKGRVEPTADPRKLSAQLKDARAQREQNFLSKYTGDPRRSSRLQSISQIPSQASSTRRRRAATWAAEPDMNPPMTEGEEPQNEEGETVKPPRHSTTLESIAERPMAEHAHEQLDDSASLTTLGADDDDFGEKLENIDLDPLIVDPLEEEIHNNHTSWSVYRTQFREPLAELLAVVVQLTIGFCADLSVTVADAGNPNTTDWAWGFATMIGIYISGGISGAHLNPTITTMLWFFRGFPKSKMPEYFIAQFLGAFIAALVAYGCYYASVHEYLLTNDTSGIVTSFVTSRRYTYIDVTTAFFNEFIGTAFLTATVLALGDDSNAPPGAGMNSLIIGLVVTVLSMSFAYQTGAALNPSRDFGPRLALLALGYGGDLFTNPYWFYGPFAATLCGSFTGAFLYDSMIFTGGESPINYPWSRTKRAAHKSKKKWKRRLHLSKDDGHGDEVLERMEGVVG